MTSTNVVNSLRRLEYEYNQLTDFGNKQFITQYFDSYYFKINLHHSFNSETAIIINKINFCIKRKNNKQLQQKLINQILPHDISLKITNDFLTDIDSLSFQIDIQYDPLNYPFSPPFWNLKHITNNGFFQQTNKDIIHLIHTHNQSLINEWNITLSRDLFLFIYKLKTLIQQN
jgi:hypothetical protein